MTAEVPNSQSQQRLYFKEVDSFDKLKQNCASVTFRFGSGSVFSARYKLELSKNNQLCLKRQFLFFWSFRVKIENLKTGTRNHTVWLAVLNEQTLDASVAARAFVADRAFDLFTPDNIGRHKEIHQHTFLGRYYLPVNTHLDAAENRCWPNKSAYADIPGSATIKSFQKAVEDDPEHLSELIASAFGEDGTTRERSRIKYFICHYLTRHKGCYQFRLNLIAQALHHCSANRGIACCHTAELFSAFNELTHRSSQDLMLAWTLLQFPDTRAQQEMRSAGLQQITTDTEDDASGIARDGGESVQPIRRTPDMLRNMLQIWLTLKPADYGTYLNKMKGRAVLKSVLETMIPSSDEYNKIRPPGVGRQRGAERQQHSRGYKKANPQQLADVLWNILLHIDEDETDCCIDLIKPHLSDEICLVFARNYNSIQDQYDVPLNAETPAPDILPQAEPAGEVDETDDPLPENRVSDVTSSETSAEETLIIRAGKYEQEASASLSSKMKRLLERCEGERRQRMSDKLAFYPHGSSLLSESAPAGDQSDEPDFIPQLTLMPTEAEKLTPQICAQYFESFTAQMKLLESCQAMREQLRKEMFSSINSLPGKQQQMLAYEMIKSAEGRVLVDRYSAEYELPLVRLEFEYLFLDKMHDKRLNDQLCRQFIDTFTETMQRLSAVYVSVQAAEKRERFVTGGKYTAMPEANEDSADSIDCADSGYVTPAEENASEEEPAIPECGDFSASPSWDDYSTDSAESADIAELQSELLNKAAYFLWLKVNSPEDQKRLAEVLQKDSYGRQIIEAYMNIYQEGYPLNVPVTDGNKQHTRASASAAQDIEPLKSNNSFTEGNTGKRLSLTDRPRGNKAKRPRYISIQRAARAASQLTLK